MNTLTDHQIAEALGYTIDVKQHKLGVDFNADLPIVLDEVRYYHKDGEFLDINKFSPSANIETAIDILDQFNIRTWKLSARNGAFFFSAMKDSITISGEGATPEGAICNGILQQAT
jgi:hypothetical protein